VSSATSQFLLSPLVDTHPSDTYLGDLGLISAEVYTVFQYAISSTGVNQCSEVFADVHYIKFVT